MDWQRTPEEWSGPESGSIGARRRWVSHARHETITAPHRTVGIGNRVEESHALGKHLVMLDGSKGEGGGQILRTALTLSLLTGRPFRIVKIRANREKPGLRPQHLKAVEAAAQLGGAEVTGASAGSRDLVFRPQAYTPCDRSIDIGTAGSTALVLQTLHLPLAMRTEQAVRITLSGGTFNTKAPSFPFLETTWRAYLGEFGLPVALAMPSAGFYPRGGGRLDAWIEPGQPRAWARTDRGPLVRIKGVAGVANLRSGIAERMRDRAESRLAEHGFAAEIDLAEWSSPGQGAAIRLTAEHERGVPTTFVGLGERGKPAEAVADEAVNELLAYESVPAGAVDPHSADQILLPLALASGRSEYTVSEVTEHLRTNVETIRAFLERAIELQEASGDRPGRIIIA